MTLDNHIPQNYIDSGLRHRFGLVLKRKDSKWL